MIYAQFELETPRQRPSPSSYAGPAERERLVTNIVTDVPSKPMLHLFGTGNVAPQKSPSAAKNGGDATKVAKGQEAAPGGSTVDEQPRTYIGPDGILHEGDISTARYQWRCKVCHSFGRAYRPDAERVKQAQDYAHSHRAMIHSAFDAGTLMELVLKSLVFYTKPEIENENLHICA